MSSRGNGGFTLVEMLISTAVLGIAMTFIVPFISAIYQGGTQAVDADTLQVESRAAVDSLVADLREAYTGDPTTTRVASISATAITFYAPDRQTPFHLRKIAYTVSGGSFQRTVATSSNTSGPPWSGLTTLPAYSTVVPDVVANPGSTPVFSYQKADGTTATSASQVSRVVVTLTVKARGSHSATSTYQSSATLRTSS